MQLVYARPEPEGAEPLVAVVGTEAEARSIEAQVGALLPTARVVWETQQVLGGPADPVHLVLLGAGASPGTPGTPGTEILDPVAVKVFARREAAEDEVAQRAATSAGEAVVLSVPLGWRRPGWPFDPDRDPPGDQP